MVAGAVQLIFTLAFRGELELKASAAVTVLGTDGGETNGVMKSCASPYT